MGGQQPPGPIQQTCAEREPARPVQRVRWYHKIAALVYVFFCFELGAFLIVFPWIGLWTENFFSSFGPAWYSIWINPYFRGAISGLGIVNIMISFAELWSLRRAPGNRGGAPSGPDLQ